MSETEGKKMVTPAQLSIILNVEYQSVAILRGQGMPCYRVGRGKKRPRYRFDVDEVRGWLKGRN